MKILDNQPRVFGDLKESNLFRKGENIYMKVYSADGYKAIRLDTGDTYNFKADSEIIFLKDVELAIN